MKPTNALLPFLLLGSPAIAADKTPPPKVIEDITRCRGIQDDSARLACFDAAAGALANATEDRSIVVLDKAEVQRTRRSLFGFTLPNLPFLGKDRDDGRKDGNTDTALQELSTTIVAVAPSGYGLWTVTLAEGGTWRTIEQERSLEPRSGMTITVKRGAFGNYLATIGGRRAIRLQRVR